MSHKREFQDGDLPPPKKTNTASISTQDYSKLFECEDVLNIIFGYLNPSDRWKFRQTCTMTHQVYWKYTNTLTIKITEIVPGMTEFFDVYRRMMSEVNMEALYNVIVKIDNLVLEQIQKPIVFGADRTWKKYTEFLVDPFPRLFAPLNEGMNFQPFSGRISTFHYLVCHFETQLLKNVIYMGTKYFKKDNVNYCLRFDTKKLAYMEYEHMNLASVLYEHILRHRSKDIITMIDDSVNIDGVPILESQWHYFGSPTQWRKSHVVLFRDRNILDSEILDQFERTLLHDLTQNYTSPLQESISKIESSNFPLQFYRSMSRYLITPHRQGNTKTLKRVKALAIEILQKTPEVFPLETLDQLIQYVYKPEFELELELENDL